MARDRSRSDRRVVGNEEEKKLASHSSQDEVRTVELSLDLRLERTLCDW